jgi:diguanylate cyclase (GGDEF)-like protein/PAS domain S-box-containing protein
MMRQPIILLVDDAPTNLNLMASILHRDYQIKMAANGLLALELAHQTPLPDLILLDISMPEMDGYEVCRRLKSDALTRDIPVIFVSASSDIESQRIGLELGAVDYIIKPIIPELIKLRIRNHLAYKQQFEHLQLTEKIFENTTEGIIITDATGAILEVNRGFTEITGFNRDEAIGSTPHILSSGFQNEKFYEEMWLSLTQNGHWAGELYNRKKNGDTYPEYLSITSVLNARNEITHFVGIFSDISRIKQHEKQLERIAHYDALTGIPNRMLLADRMQQGLAQAKREKKLIAVCYLDLDGFKPINDTHGHDAGDQVLVEVAKRISNSVRSGDTVARLGGDEFAVLLLGLDSIQECTATLTRVLDAINKPILVKEQICTVSASMGVSIYPLDDEDTDILLRHADQAMYNAKRAGKNRFHLYDPSHDHLSQTRQETLKRIRHGVKNNEFALYYQPKVEMCTRRIIGAEALARWNHPERGLLSPIEFLPVIENSNLENTFGEWVINAALKQADEWRQQHLPMEVSVNISANHLQSEDFVEKLQRSLSKYPHLPHGSLQIEILETAALEDIPTVTKIIEACHELGVSFALDDFGTGYSSLSYLSNLPVDTIKIDQSFVIDMLKYPGDRTIVQGVIALSKAFGLKCVAEGVETPEHYDVLLEMGCEIGQGFGQGFGIARPMDAQAFVDWYKIWT